MVNMLLTNIRHVRLKWLNGPLETGVVAILVRSMSTLESLIFDHCKLTEIDSLYETLCATLTPVTAPPSFTISDDSSTKRRKLQSRFPSLKELQYISTYSHANAAPLATFLCHATHLKKLSFSPPMLVIGQDYEATWTPIIHTIADGLTNLESFELNDILLYASSADDMGKILGRLKVFRLSSEMPPWPSFFTDLGRSGGLTALTSLYIHDMEYNMDGLDAFLRSAKCLKHLELRGCHFAQERVIDSMVDAISTLPLTRLAFGSSVLLHEDLMPNLRRLFAMPTLRELDLSSMNLKRYLMGLWRHLSVSPGLAWVTIQGVGFRDDHVTDLVEQMRSASWPGSIRYLDMANNSITYAGLTKLAEYFLGDKLMVHESFQVNMSNNAFEQIPKIIPKHIVFDARPYLFKASHGFDEG